jgi:hypothetical protein
MRDNLILLRYVYDCLLFCPDERAITKVIQELKQTLILEDQGDVDAYLGIDTAKCIVDKRPQIKLLQPHLIQ